MKNFGLLGKNIDYSFSRGYFKDKFETHKLDCTYNNFDIESIEDFESDPLQKCELKTKQFELKSSEFFNNSS